MPDIQLEKMKHWIHAIPQEAYFEAARVRPPGLGKDPQFLQLQREMRALVPVKGLHWVHDIDVLIEPGQNNHQGQSMHHHPEWTALFYVAVGDPVVKTHVYLNEGSAIREHQITPEPGDCLIIPPGVIHHAGASKSETPRLAFAMLVQAPGAKSKYASSRS